MKPLELDTVQDGYSTRPAHSTYASLRYHQGHMSSLTLIQVIQRMLSFQRLGGGGGHGGRPRHGLKMEEGNQRSWVY